MKQNSDLKKKRKQLEVPLMLRCYTNRIEDEIGLPLPFLPQSEIAGKKTREVEILKRFSLWKSYFKNNEAMKNLYIISLLNELNKAFLEFSQNNSNLTFEEFVCQFCISVAWNHKKVSECISHGLDVCGKKVKALRRFDKVIDTFMTISYNAVIGFEESSSSESEDE